MLEKGKWVNESKRSKNKKVLAILGGMNQNLFKPKLRIKPVSHRQSPSATENSTRAS